MREDWWNEFFDLEVAGLILEKPRPGELDFLVEHLQLVPGTRVFDQCCGWGRVAGPLSDLGCDVRGVDSNSELIQEGRRLWPTVCFDLADASNFPIAAEYDASMNLYSSFACRDCDHYNFQVLQNLASSVKPLGRLVLDVINPGRVLANFQAKMTQESSCGTRIERQSELLGKREEPPILSQLWTFVRPDGTSYRRGGIAKLYSAEVLQDMLKRAGCETLHLFGDLASNQYHNESERLILVAQKTR